MKETSEKLLIFSIGIDFFGPDPTKSKNKAKKNMQVARLGNLSEDQLCVYIACGIQLCSIVWPGL